MITSHDKMSINAFINRMRDEYVAFMGIDALPEMSRKPFEIDMQLAAVRGVGSWACVKYDSEDDKYVLEIWKDLYQAQFHAEYLMFHEFTHAYDIERLARGNKTKYCEIKGYMEYHAAQVEMLKLLGIAHYNDQVSFSMDDTVKTVTKDLSVFELLLARKKDATEAIRRPDFPRDIETLNMVIGIIFNHLGRVSVCKRFSRDYDKYRDQLEEYSVEKDFFSEPFWNSIILIYHDEMEQMAIDLAMKFHIRILGSMMQKYGLQC